MYQLSHKNATMRHLRMKYKVYRYKTKNFRDRLVKAVRVRINNAIKNFRLHQTKRHREKLVKSICRKTNYLSKQDKPPLPIHRGNVFEYELTKIY